MLFYCLYLSTSVFLGIQFFFFRSIPEALDENYFGYLALMEFGVLLFLRTRSAIKHLPRTIIAINIIFLLYVQFTVYGFYYLAFYTMIFASLAYFGLILFYFEVPAVQWNPSYHYTPCIDRPRTLYFPLFSMSWIYDLPPLWTLFYPLHGRNFFT